MTEQRLIVDVTDIALRLQCKCGTAVSVVPNHNMKQTVFICSNCGETWPGAVTKEGLMLLTGAAAQRLAGALAELAELQAEAAAAPTQNNNAPRYHVQFEVRKPQV
jgi:hypothetical protein